MLLDGAVRPEAIVLKELKLDSQVLGDALAQLGMEGFTVRRLSDDCLVLPDPPVPLNLARIEHALTSAGVVAAGHVELLPAPGSTNDNLLQRTDSIHGLCCLAEWQAAGRGRLGRRWQAAPYGSILLSLGWEHVDRAATLMGISLVAGVAAIRALRCLGITGVGLKWPNDLMAGERKLGGVLVELQKRESGAVRCAVGVGLNVKMNTFNAASIGQPWIDLAALGDEVIDRSTLAAEMIIQLCQILEQFVHSGFEPLRDEWSSHHLHHGELVVVSIAGEQIRGTAIGVDSDGALLLQEVSGSLRRVLSGVVSLRRVQ